MEGDELTVITWGAMVQKSIEAVQSLEIQNDSVEVIDLRTLNPLDMDLIETSIMKTSKALEPCLFSLSRFQLDPYPMGLRSVNQ